MSGRRRDDSDMNIMPIVSGIVVGTGILACLYVSRNPEILESVNCMLEELFGASFPPFPACPSQQDKRCRINPAKRRWPTLEEERKQKAKLQEERQRIEELRKKQEIIERKEREKQLLKEKQQIEKNVEQLQKELKVVEERHRKEELQRECQLREQQERESKFKAHQQKVEQLKEQLLQEQRLLEQKQVDFETDNSRRQEHMT